jgi:CRP-like cAMP-binding protein
LDGLLSNSVQEISNKPCSKAGKGDRMLSLRHKISALLPPRALRGDESLEDLGVDVERVVSRIRESEFFCNLSADVISELVDAMEILNVRVGATIMRQGDKGDAYFVLASGRAVVTHLGAGQEGVRVLAEVTEPTGFGEEALLGRQARPVSVIMDTPGILLRMRRDTFANFVGTRAVDWVDAHSDMHAFGSIRIWVGSERRRHPVGEGVLSIPLTQLRERIAELDRNLKCYCYCRDGKESAIAAFLLTQRGFDAQAVQDGRNAIARDAA